MKPAFVLLTLFLTYHQVFSQSIYSQKWKESTFFQVPHSFDVETKNSSQVTYVDEKNQARLEIKELSSPDRAETREALNEMAMKTARQLNYVNLEIIDQELLNSHESNADFLGSAVIVKGKGKKSLLKILYSRKTRKNYIVLVEANTKYFKENKQLVRRLSEGLIEY